MKEEKILLAGIEDKWRQCREYYAVTSTGFLDLHQRSLAENLCRELTRRDETIRYAFYGGYEEAERTVLMFLPEYIDAENLSELARSGPLAGLRLHHRAGGRDLHHGDYLGSLTGLGLKRETIGDILVNEAEADVIVLEEIRTFLLTHYDKAGRTELFPESIELSELHVPKLRMKEYRDTVASLRLDNVIASAFSMSRGLAAEAIKSGIVFVNHMQADKVSMIVREGDQLVCRGRGKAILQQTGGKTRKGRTVIVLKKYI